MNIRILSDGKQGHLNQSLGLAQALIAKAGGPWKRWTCRDFPFWGNPEGRLRQRHAAAGPVHLRRTRHAHPAHLRPPSFQDPGCPLHEAHASLHLFDLCLIPRHDLRPGRDYTDTGIFPTHGALHPMRPDPSIPKDITLILIGGPSKDFDWDDEAMLNQLSDISINTPGNIVLTTSRRTPTGFAEKIQTAVPEITVVPVEETQPGWVARHLAHASATWVSQDSVSMVYEALGAGAPVGVLAVPRRHGNRKSRILSGLEMLEKEGLVTGYRDWKKQGFRLAAPGAPLLEADRAADYILTRFFPQLHAL